MKFLILLLIICSCNQTGTSSLSSNTSFVTNEAGVSLSLSSGVYQYSDNTYEKNCLGYFDSSLYTSQGSSVYRIDPYDNGSTLDVYCDMELEGGGWTLLLYHDTDKGVFSSKNEARLFNEADPTNTGRYSILTHMDAIRSVASFEFYTSWPTPGGCNPNFHHWTQLSNPMASNETVSGFSRIGGNTNNVNGTAGLCLSSSGSTLLDGNCGHSNWWYAIGQRTIYQGGIPACGSIETKIRLYIR